MYRLSLVFEGIWQSKAHSFRPNTNKLSRPTEPNFALKKPRKNRAKLRQTIDGLSVYEWFRAKQNEFLRGIGVNIRRRKGKKVYVSAMATALFYMLKTFLGQILSVRKKSLSLQNGKTKYMELEK